MSPFDVRGFLYTGTEHGLSKPETPVLIVSPLVRVVVRADIQPGMFFLADGETFQVNGEFPYSLKAIPDEEFIASPEEALAAKLKLAESSLAAVSHSFDQIAAENDRLEKTLKAIRQLPNDHDLMHNAVAVAMYEIALCGPDPIIWANTDDDGLPKPSVPCDGIYEPRPGWPS